MKIRKKIMDSETAILAVEIAQHLKKMTKRKVVYAPGKYHDFSTSKTSCCWDGESESEYKDCLIASAQPTPSKKGDKSILIFDFIKKEDIYDPITPEPEGRKCVHTQHCCVNHGCKYGDPDCPVWLGKRNQSYPCESCSMYEDINSLSEVVPVSKKILDERIAQYENNLPDYP